MRLPLCMMGLLSGLLLGCAANGDDGSYPSRPGNGGSIGGGGGGGSGVDGGTDGNSDGAMAIGRVCLITDLRFPTSCAASGAGNLTVKRGTATMTTQASGEFTLPPASTVGDRWLVTGTGMTLVPSVVPFVPGAEVRLPIIAKATYDALLQANGITQLDGRGAVHVISLRPNGTPKPAVVVSADPTGPDLPIYGANNPTVWSPTPGTSGVALVTNLLGGTPIAVGGVADVTTNLLGLPVVTGSITYVRLPFLQ